MYEGCRVYGPYDRKQDNRQHVIVIFPGGKRKTISYPRYIIEMNIGRYLTKEEEVHHIDNNEKNNVINNLVVIPTAVHKRMQRGSKFEELTKEIHICPTCKMQFTLTLEQAKDRYFNDLQGKHGPFCSKSCAGKFGTIVQKIYQNL